MRQLFGRRWLIGLLALTLMTQVVSGRVRKPWAASKLTEKADLIIIARFLSSRDAKNSDKAPEPFTELVDVDSKFQVLAVVKGKLEDKELILFHFRNPKPARNEKGETKVAPDRDNRMTELVSLRQTPDIDGPGLLRFDPDPDKGLRYLMFLKRRSDGRYECVSGQVDPDLSVSRLDGPSDD